MKLLRGRSAFVTGAASGIGRAIALKLAREGVDLVLSDRDAAGLAATELDARALGVNVTSAMCDLTQPAAISAMLSRLFAEAPLHILVNCAGLSWFGRQHATTDAQWRAIMAVNLLAPMQITTELLPTLLRADEAHIVNVASMLGLAPGRKLAAYSASKYGLVGFTMAMRADYHRKFFGITALCPGFVRTPMLAVQNGADSKQPKIPDWLSTTPEHVADIAVDAILRDRGLVLITALARLLWWMNRLSPSLLDYLNREGWRQRGRIVPEVVAGTSASASNPSCPGSTRASTETSTASLQDVDGRDKPGHDA